MRDHSLAVAIDLPHELESTRLSKPFNPTLALALSIALIAHLLAILGLRFDLLKTARQVPEVALEVLLLHESGMSSPPDRDAVYSQRDHHGLSARGDGTESVEDEGAARSTTIDQQSADQDMPAPLITASPLEHTLQASLQPLATSTPEASSAWTTPAQPIDAARILATRDTEIARLNANLSGLGAPQRERLRRRSVSANTREFRYASYLGAWARKVERIGNINYPQAAREQRIFGSLILNVAVRSDGGVEQIRVVRSSGYALLDQAAIRIVELAAPFSPFPPDIAAETDVLDIVRTWQFTRGGELEWER